MKRVSLLLVVLLLVSVFAVQAEEAPAVEVSDQVILDNRVRVDSVYSDGPGFIVVHADNDGAPGAGVGVKAVPAGWSYGVDIAISPRNATPVLYAMLHVDDSAVGTYEFGTVEGADGPVMGDNGMVSPGFKIELVAAYDQWIMDNVLSIPVIITQQDGWLVIHNDNEGGPGAPAGNVFVPAGVNQDVAVTLDGSQTATLFPMMHSDTGVMGEYEFGTVEGADSPIAIDGVFATAKIYQGTASMRVPAQVVTDTVTATSVVAEVDGWLVIHADGGGKPGPVIGQALVPAGLSVNVAVSVDPMGVTPVLFPMLHVDTGVAGEYEFGTVEGADGPVMVGDNALVYPIDAAPSINYIVSLIDGGVIVAGALMDADGWMVIHADNNGGPGAVLGQTRILAGHSSNIVVSLDTEAAGSSVFPMLHYDTGVIGAYEFGTVEGADGPVSVGGNVITGPASLGE